MALKVVLHHSAVSRKHQPYQAWAVNRYHKEKWNMKSSLGFYAGYHYFIEPNGYMIQFREIGEKGAHTIGHNDAIGICLAGDFSLEMPTTAQVNKLQELLIDLKEWEIAEVGDFYNHRELQENRTCPGHLLTNDWIRKLADPDYGENDDKEDNDKYIMLMQQKRTLLDQIQTLLHKLISTLQGRNL